MKGPFVHIGYHKTGTTWLQQFLFKNPNAGFRMLPRKIVQDHLIHINPLVFSRDHCRNLLSEQIKKLCKDEFIPVLSEERLSGSPHSGGYDSKELAHRICNVFPNARILIVIREQNRMLQSMYKQYIIGVGAASIEEYLDPPIIRKYPMFDLRHLEYDQLIGHYRTLFGEEHVLVLPYELFREEPKTFVDRIAKFGGGKMLEKMPADERINVAHSAFAISLKRRLNPFCMGEFHNLGAQLYIPKLGPLLMAGLNKADRHLVPQRLKVWSDRKM